SGQKINPTTVTEIRDVQNYVESFWPAVVLPRHQTANWNFHQWNENLDLWNSVNEWELHSEELTKFERSRSDSSASDVKQALHAFDQFLQNKNMSYYQAAAALYYLRLDQILSTPELREKMSVQDISEAFNSIGRFNLHDFYKSDGRLFSDLRLDPLCDPFLSRIVVNLVDKLYDLGFERAKTPQETLEVGKLEVSHWHHQHEKSLSRNFQFIVEKGDSNYFWVSQLYENMIRPFKWYLNHLRAHPLLLIHGLIENIPAKERSDATVFPLLASIVLYPRYLNKRAKSQIADDKYGNTAAKLFGEDIARKAFHIETVGAKLFRIMATDREVSDIVEADQKLILRTIESRLKSGASPDLLGDFKPKILNLLQTQKIPPRASFNPLVVLANFCKRNRR
ncbi:MAG: hypothetical protein JWQ35_1029, partial [Bacteriovoracaceae bacterium]|nr:hypothetical protein [Bacteriovoracaceae bacterium]